MARYIVKSRIPLPVTAATRQCRMTPQERKKQIDEVKSLRDTSKLSGKISEWMGDNSADIEAELDEVEIQPRARARSSKASADLADAVAELEELESQPRARARSRTTSAKRRSPKGAAPVGKGVTGTYLVELAPAQAAQLTADLPDVTVIADRPITLIEPIQTEDAGAKLDANEKPWLWVHEMVRATFAKGRGITGKGVTVGILDTGIDSAHPELAGRVVRGVALDVAAGQWTDVNPLKDTATHGTHVAGIIAGANVGCAPGVKLAGAVMIPGGNGWLSDFLLALEWAANTPEIQIVNMSAGLPGFFPEMLDSVKEVISVGLLPVIATGNEGRNTSRSPGNYDAPISVGACDRNRRVASFSSGGTIVYQNQQYLVPDLVAPGVGVYSCVPNGGYALKDGTSMATPVVTAVAALLLEQYPTATVPDLIEALVTTCDDLSLPNLVVPPDRQGHGLVNYEKAMSYFPQDV